MGARLRSLSEDAVDAYTHTWSVVLFLLLAFLLLLVPSKHSTVLEQTKLPAFQASCWCPAAFEESQVRYTNVFCSGHLTNLLRGQSDPNENDFRNVPTPADDKGKGSKGDEEESEERRFVMGSVRDHGAFFLFILAICLRLPRMLWSILSGCCDSVNVGRTLQSAEKADAMSYEGRQQKYAGLVKAFIDYTRMGRKTATCLYLVMKSFMIIVIIAEIVVTCFFILPEIQEFSWFGPISKVRLHKKLPVYTCSLKVVSPVTGISDDYSIQCYLTERQQVQESQLTFDNPMIPSNVFLVALTNLVFLLAINLLNTFVWVVRLTRYSSRQRFGLAKDSPFDLVFMIQMARANLGIDVALGLAESVSGGQLVEGGEQAPLQSKM